MCSFLIVFFVLYSPAGTGSDMSDVPETAVLDHTMQHDKIHAGQAADVKRRRPSREHIHRLSRELDPDQQAEVCPLCFLCDEFL
jgi:hypothetical protein